MRFPIAILSTILLLSGCGSMKQASLAGDANHATTADPNYQRDLPQDPKVVFIGDDVTANWFPKSSLWINKGIAGENSTQILARFQADVVSLHPDIVHILVGTQDVFPGWDACGEHPTDGGPFAEIDSCTNIMTMITEAQAASIKVILGTIPPWGPPADSATAHYENIDQLNGRITQYAATYGVTVIDYHTALIDTSSDAFEQEYAPGLTTNGIDPDAAGYAIMTPLAAQAIAALKVHGKS